MSTALKIAQGKFGRVALLDMDKPLVPHAHSQCHVVFKASGADTFFSVRDRQQPVTDRTAVLVNTWEPHFYTHRPDAPRTVFLALYIEPRWLAEIHGSLRLSGRPDFFPQPCVEISPRIRRLADNLIAELLMVGQVPQERIEAALFELMIAVIEPFSEWRSMSDVLLTAAQPIPDARIHRAITVMKENLGAQLDMDQLAAAAHLSRAQFFVRFRRCTRMTPNVFINMLRVEHACRCLADADGQRPMRALSEELGFVEQGHFTRFMRGHVGVTPSEYRRVVDVYRA